MCGGRGTRLESAREKPLYPIGGLAMVDRVLRALAESHLERTYAVVSPHAPETRAHLEAAGVALLETPGEGYVADLVSALADERVDTPVLTVAADLPLLERAVIDRVLEVYERDCGRGDGGRVGEAGSPREGPSMTVCVPTALKRRLGVSRETTLEQERQLAPTGVNVVGNGEKSREMRHTSYDPRLAINVNRPEDARVAETTTGTMEREYEREGGDVERDTRCE